MRSRNVRQEVLLAWRYEKPYLPLLLDDSLLSINGFPEQIEYWLEGNQWVEILDNPEDHWLPRVVRALEKGISGTATQPSTISSTYQVPAPIRADYTIHGLLSLAGYTDQLWPTTPDEAANIRGITRGAGLRGCRDIAAPQDGVGHSFRIGDPLNVVLETAREGYLTLLDFGTSGQIYCVCPSQFIPDPHLEPGKYVFPVEGSPYRTFFATGLPGREQLLAIITDEPLNLEWMPKDPKVPAKILSASDLSLLLDTLQKMDQNHWAAYATYFTISA